MNIKVELQVPINGQTRTVKATLVVDESQFTDLVSDSKLQFTTRRGFTAKDFANFNPGDKPTEYSKWLKKNGLSTRTANVLARNRLEIPLPKVFHLSEEEILSLTDAGKETVREIMFLQARMRLEGPQMKPIEASSQFGKK